MGTGTGEGRADRLLAPAITGRERDEKDPPIMEQWENEIKQATGFLDSQMTRIRNYTDSIFGAEPVNEKSDDTDKMAEVRPHTDRIGAAIMALHTATSAVSYQLDRLEGHRLV